MALTKSRLDQGLRGGLFLACCLAAATVWSANVTTRSTSYVALGAEAGRLIATDAGGNQVRILRREGTLTALPREAPVSDDRPADILPDGVVASGTGEIRRAWLGGPTRRYDHAVLGDDLEAARLIVVDRQDRRHVVELPSHQVFEDRYPRLVDLEDDGASEIVLIRSDIRQGAAVALYALQDGGLTELATSDPIGQSHRWLNVAGTADFDGDGQKEIAVVVTPHIGGTLTLLRRQGDALTAVARQHGFSNHAYGSRELGMSVVLDYNGDGVADLAVPDARRESVVVATFAGGAYRQLDRVFHDAPVTSAMLLVDVDDDGEHELAYLLADGTLVLAGPVADTLADGQALGSQVFGKRLARVPLGIRPQGPAAPDRHLGPGSGEQLAQFAADRPAPDDQQGVQDPFERQGTRAVEAPVARITFPKSPRTGEFSFY